MHVETWQFDNRVSKGLCGEGHKTDLMLVNERGLAIHISGCPREGPQNEAGHSIAA